MIVTQIEVVYDVFCHSLFTTLAKRENSDECKHQDVMYFSMKPIVYEFRRRSVQICMPRLLPRSKSTWTGRQQHSGIERQQMIG
jgi:hypothetical protein